ncbi:MAG: YidC/Oxa1 family membrane protein insertase [Bacilli bacterium]|nr:YidC/Oxa1 family membrane protein insertase [Bacillota bacterium]MBR6821187.1 YidC/Oxa1 family membrane protein insertase [Bacilli bacterium]
MKKKIKIVVIALLFLLCTGCSETLKDGKQAVINKETGQTLTSNILCRPEEKNLLETYEKYDDKLLVKLEDLPTCKTFTPNKLEYQSLWESIFVKPLAWLILKLGYLVKNMGISVMVIGLLIRIAMMPLQIKTVKQSENMKKLQPEIARIEKKYQNKTDNDSLMMKSQETMMLYKKYNINPVSSCLGAFIQLPLFFAFLEAINRVPAIFEGEFLGMNLGMTPTAGIAGQNYIYIVLIVLIILSTFLSFKNSMSSQNQTPEMEQQMKFMFIFMIIMISFASLSLPTAIALYWIVTNGFAVIQNIIIKKIIEKRI